VRKMISVSTFLKENNSFVPIESDHLCIQDDDYIEGALVLCVDGEELIGLDCYDYIDELLSYIITGIDDLLDGKEFFTYFPDQPLGLKFSPKSAGYFLFELTSSKEHKKKLIETKGFVDAMFHAMDIFFTRLKKEIDPDECEFELSRVEILKKKADEL